MIVNARMPGAGKALSSQPAGVQRSPQGGGHAVTGFVGIASGVTAIPREKLNCPDLMANRHGKRFVSQIGIKLKRGAEAFSRREE
jgi:hypothetical protein